MPNPFTQSREDLSGFSDEELLSQLKGSVMALRGSQLPTPPPQAPNPTEGMTPFELARAGLGKMIYDPLKGIQEAIQVAGRGSDAELTRINQDKAERAKADKALMDTGWGSAGNTLGKVALAAAAPARLPAQVAVMATEAALTPSDQSVTGTGQMLFNRGIKAGEAGLGTYLPGKVINAMGRMGTAAAKDYRRPEGVAALKLSQDADKLGIKTTVGDLDPTSYAGRLESVLPGERARVAQQVEDFTAAARKTKDIPSSTGRSTTERVLEGEKLREGIVDAGEALKSSGQQRWSELDSFLGSNSLPGVRPVNTQTRANLVTQNYTPVHATKGPQLNRNPILQRIDEFDPEAVTLLNSLSTVKGKPIPLSFSEMHQLQTAVGKAMGRADIDAATPGSAMQVRKIKTELKNLYASISNDIDNWGVGNPQAMSMYKNAKDYWRDAVVPGAINNKVLSKANKGEYGTNPRAYAEPHELYSGINTHPRGMSELTPFMSPESQELFSIYRGLPNLSRALSTPGKEVNIPGSGSPLSSLAGMATGHPLLMAKATLAHLPGVQQLANSNFGKQVHFSRNPWTDTGIGHGAYGANEYLSGPVEEFISNLRKGK